MPLLRRSFNHPEWSISSFGPATTTRNAGQTQILLDTVLVNGTALGSEQLRDNRGF